MTDYTKLLNKLVPSPGGEDTVRMRTATVTAINSNGTVRISVSGVTIPKDISRLASSSMSMGDTVSVISFRGELLVIGAVAGGPTAGAMESHGDIRYFGSNRLWYEQRSPFDLTTPGLVLTNNPSIEVARSGTCAHFNRIGDGVIVSLRQNGAQQGTISVNSSGDVSFNNTSDYRLKENVQEITGALDRVNALRPVTFNWINGGPGEGFIAHEVQSVVPLAVTGEKDAVAPAPVDDDDPAEGSIIPQVMDQAKLIPILTGAVQELSAMVEALTTRVAELEDQLGGS